MPRKIELTWEPGPRRWRRVYKGKTYIVSCKALGVPDNRRDSYLAANEWWETTLAGIVGESTERRVKLEEILRARESAEGRYVLVSEPEPSEPPSPDRTVRRSSPV